MLNDDKITSKIGKEAHRLGFDDIGISAAIELFDNKKYFTAWLKGGLQAGMKFMEKNIEKRVNPALLVDECLSVITVIKNYYPKNSKLSTQIPKISRFAYGNDYHSVMKNKMEQLFSFIKTELYPNLKGRCFVDSAPILERALGVRAGLGWIGKNGMLINRNLGSYFFMGELLLNVKLPFNKNEEKNRCGKCNLCIDSCPVGAINQNKTIDSNKCISYHTIENKGIIPKKIIQKQNGWIFGCDICQEVCPWNKKAKSTEETEFQPSELLKNMTKEDWQNLTQEKFDNLFKHSTINRTGFLKIKRNIDAG